MPQTCCGVSRADSGALGTSEAERVMAMRRYSGAWMVSPLAARGERSKFVPANFG